MSEIVEGIKDAILEYQVGPSPATHGITCLGTVQFAQQNSLHEKSCRLIVCPGCFV